MAPKVQVGTVLIEERPLFISGGAVRTIFLPEHDSDAGRGIHNRHCFGAIGVALSRGIYDAIRPTAKKR
jgi:hypothetical protein